MFLKSINECLMNNNMKEFYLKLGFIKLQKIKSIFLLTN